MGKNRFSGGPKLTISPRDLFFGMTAGKKAIFRDFFREM